MAKATYCLGKQKNSDSSPGSNSKPTDWQADAHNWATVTKLNELYKQMDFWQNLENAT